MSAGNDLVVITALLIVLSVLGAFETPTVQACIPTLLEGENMIRGNAAVNWVASLSGLVAPTLGGIFYAAFGLKPVMYASVACFFVTAAFECFIQLNSRRMCCENGIWTMVKRDFITGTRYIFRERTSIAKMLLLVALSGFFAIGVTEIGLPYLVRSVLLLDAKYYGAAESALALAAIAGSTAAGLLAGRLKIRRLSSVLASLGLFILPAGIVFLAPAGSMIQYAVSIVSFCGMQISISIFSVHAVSLIQQRTPDHLIGKVMSYTSAITLCAQPVGQVMYGFLFDRFRNIVSLILIPTAFALCAVGLCSARFFRKMETELSETAES